MFLSIDPMLQTRVDYRNRLSESIRPVQIEPVPSPLFAAGAAGRIASPLSLPIDFMSFR
jgi:hypothetical protein